MPDLHSQCHLNIRKRATDLSLSVRVIVDVDGQSASHPNGNSCRQTPLDGILHQVEGRGCVDGWHPVQATPAQVVAGPVMGNVHGSPVSSLPPARQGRALPLISKRFIMVQW